MEGIEVDTATIEQLYFEEQARVLAEQLAEADEPARRPSRAKPAPPRPPRP